MNRVDEEKVLEVGTPEQSMTVARVWRDWNGSALTQDVAIGATTLYVENTVDFDEDGGTLLLDDETVTYSAIDDDLETITCTALTAAHSRGAFAYAGERKLGPRRADGYMDGEYVQGVFIPRMLWPHFPLGKREPEDMEVVPVEWDEDGSPRVKDGPPEDTDSGGSIYEALFFKTGTLSVGGAEGRYYATEDCEILSVTASVSTAPTGASVIIDVNKDGTTVFTNQADRPTITAGSNVTQDNVPRITSLPKGSYLTAAIDQVGSTVAGAGLTVQVLLVRSAQEGIVGAKGDPGEAGSGGSSDFASLVKVGL